MLDTATIVFFFLYWSSYTGAKTEIHTILSLLLFFLYISIYCELVRDERTRTSERSLLMRPFSAPFPSGGFAPGCFYLAYVVCFNFFLLMRCEDLCTCRGFVHLKRNWIRTLLL